MDMLTSNPAAEKETLAVNSSRYFPVITRTRFDLGLYGNEAEDKLTFFFEYCSKLFKKETIEGFIGYAKTIMSVVLENKHIQLKNIKISHVLSESKDDFSQDDYLSFKF
jgi:hypothetical protein